MAVYLKSNDELTAANDLLDEAEKCMGNTRSFILDMKLDRAQILEKTGKQLEALDLLKATLPEVKEYSGKDGDDLYVRTMSNLAYLLEQLGRYQECYDTAGELIKFTTKNFGPGNLYTLRARTVYAVACAELGHLEESKSHFDDVLTTFSQTFGRDFPLTRGIRLRMRHYGLLSESG